MNVEYWNSDIHPYMRNVFTVSVNLKKNDIRFCKNFYWNNIDELMSEIKKMIESEIKL